MLKLAEQHVLSLEPYVPGRPIENDQKITSWAKLANNENCLGPSPHAMEAAAGSLATAHLYPNALRLVVIDKVCDHFKDFSIRPEQVALGNGTSELIVNLVRGVLGSSEAMLFGWPSFIMYRLAATAHGRKSFSIPLNADMSYDLDGMIEEAKRESRTPVKLVIVANPNNPTGNYLTKQEFADFVAGLPADVVLVIDEAYFEYVMKEDYPNGLAYALSRPRTVVLRTFSKVYGMAGLRLGLAIGDPDVISVLCRIRDPFNVNTVAQHAAIAALEDHEHVKKSVHHNLQFMPVLARGLRDFGFSVHDSVGNFLLAKRHATMPSIADLSQALLSHGVIIRTLDAYGIDEFVRISVGTRREINQLFDGLRMVLRNF